MSFRTIAPSLRGVRAAALAAPVAALALLATGCGPNGSDAGSAHSGSAAHHSSGKGSSDRPASDDTTSPAHGKNGKGSKDNSSGGSAAGSHAGTRPSAPAAGTDAGLPASCPTFSKTPARKWTSHSGTAVKVTGAKAVDKNVVVSTKPGRFDVTVSNPTDKPTTGSALYLDLLGPYSHDFYAKVQVQTKAGWCETPIDYEDFEESLNDTSYPMPLQLKAHQTQTLHFRFSSDAAAAEQTDSGGDYIGFTANAKVVGASKPAGSAKAVLGADHNGVKFKGDLVGGGISEPPLHPGESREFTGTATNSSKETASGLAFSVTGAKAQDSAGKPVALDWEIDEGSGWQQLPDGTSKRNPFSLAPGATRTIKVKVTAPKNVAKAGGDSYIRLLNPASGVAQPFYDYAMLGNGIRPAE